MSDDSMPRRWRLRATISVHPSTLVALDALCEQMRTNRGRLIDKIVESVSSAYKDKRLRCITGGLCTLNRTDLPEVLQMEVVYRSAAFVKAYERGRVDALHGLGYHEMRDWAERPRFRRAYGCGFALGKTEEVLGRVASDPFAEGRSDLPEVL